MHAPGWKSPSAPCRGRLSSENLTACHLASGGGSSPKEEGAAFYSGSADAAAVAFSVFSSVDARNLVQHSPRERNTQSRRARRCALEPGQKWPAPKMMPHPTDGPTVNRDRNFPNVCGARVSLRKYWFGGIEPGPL